jgi:dienelactone hydrolase
VLAPELIGYEERQEISDEMESGRLLLQGWSLPAKTAWEVSRAVDYLASRPEAETSRIGLAGLAKGGLISWLAAAVEPRISTIVICWGTATYASILAENISLGPMGWIPGLLNWGDTPEVCCMLAPRPLLFCAAQHDPLFPFGGFQEVFWRVRQFYSRLREDEKLSHYISPQGPRLDKEVRARISNWFDRWL